FAGISADSDGDHYGRSDCGEGDDGSGEGAFAASRAAAARFGGCGAGGDGDGSAAAGQLFAIATGNDVAQCGAHGAFASRSTAGGWGFERRLLRGAELDDPGSAVAAGGLAAKFGDAWFSRGEPAGDEFFDRARAFGLYGVIGRSADRRQLVG